MKLGNYYVALLIIYEGRDYDNHKLKFGGEPFCKAVKASFDFDLPRSAISKGINPLKMVREKDKKETLFNTYCNVYYDLLSNEDYTDINGANLYTNAGDPVVLYLKPISLVEALKIKNSSNPEELLDNYKFKMLEEAYTDITEILSNMNYNKSYYGSN